MWIKEVDYEIKFTYYFSGVLLELLKYLAAMVFHFCEAGAALKEVYFSSEIKSVSMLTF